jgi:hypothetical protein
MYVPSLRDPPPILHRVREPVTLNDRDPLIPLRQHSSRDKSGYAGAEDHRVIADLAHPQPPAC